MCTELLVQCAVGLQAGVVSCSNQREESSRREMTGAATACFTLLHVYGQCQLNSTENTMLINHNNPNTKSQTQPYDINSMNSSLSTIKATNSP
ncbi:hypothetical protein RRG08_037260 [Elysia crispata]|uniref:Uncharacterized protein n=1 Tax=Elysia crispata TaxID=231223 RepID=A0AAE1CNP4_9GAST|nr:hypothetical protein RRG08_037260 [Elysia crispata]